MPSFCRDTGNASTNTAFKDNRLRALIATLHACVPGESSKIAFHAVMAHLRHHYVLPEGLVLRADLLKEWLAVNVGFRRPYQYGVPGSAIRPFVRYCINSLRDLATTCRQDKLVGLCEKVSPALSVPDDHMQAVSLTSIC